MCRPTNEMRATHENACLNAVRPPRDEAAVCNPCRDTFASGVCRRVAPIRTILNKIRIESCSTASPKQASKSIRHHCRRAVEAPLPPKIAMSSGCACYSCNTLPKRIVRAGDISAFSLCREFG
jgi:hypothetical protein